MLRKAGKGRLVAAVLVAFLALPLSAAEAAGHGTRGSELWSGFVAWLTTGSLSSLWAEDGLMIDPDGRTSPQRDEGSQIDPDGRARNTMRTDEGSQIDPNG
jgi:hypothetical protein